MQFLDAKTRRQIGFDEVWSRISPVSSLGRAQKRKATVFLAEQRADLQKELDILEQLSASLKTDPRIADNLNHLLSTIRDIGASINRSVHGISLDDLELYEIKKLLLSVGKIQAELASLQWTFVLNPSLEACEECLDALSLGQGTRDGFYIADAYAEKLAEIRLARSRLEILLNRPRVLVDDKILPLVGRILSMDGEITLSTSAREQISRLSGISELIKVKETPDVVTFQLVEDESLKGIRRDLAQLREDEEICKEQVRVHLTKVVNRHSQALLVILEQLGYVDLLLAKAKFCATFDGVKPDLWSERGIRIQEGRHLLVEDDVRQGGHDYTPLCFELLSGVTIITGPNMGGKTASLKTIGLLTAMAQYGLLVPAVAMKLAPRRFIRTHLVGTESKGLSAFAEEIVFLRDAVANSNRAGLILVDEIAHGTNPVEGAAVAQAVIENLNQKSSITVITTHYPSLACLVGICLLRVKGLNREQIAKRESFQDSMDYRIEVASPTAGLSSDAAIVAEAMGLDNEIIARAKELQRRDG